MTTRHEVSSGGVVYRRTAAGFEIAIADQKDWRTGKAQTRLPKGHAVEGETLEQAAVREVCEETSLTARVIEPLGESDYAYVDGAERVEKTVRYFLMEYVSGEPSPGDGEMDRVYWCPIEAAAARLTFENERDAVANARRRLCRAPPSDV